MPISLGKSMLSPSSVAGLLVTECSLTTSHLMYFYSYYQLWFPLPSKPGTSKSFETNLIRHLLVPG